jgi:D-methionine transport system substrate-binding protein
MYGESVGAVLDGLQAWAVRSVLGGTIALGAIIATAAPGVAAETVRVGIMSGEAEEVWAVVAEEAKARGLLVEAVTFSDYAGPNVALEKGELDANAFQHQPFLDAEIAAHGYRIVPVAFTALWPIGLYSRRYDAVADLPDGATIGIPADPANTGRALRLLERQGLLTLAEGKGLLATPADILANPKRLQISQIDAGLAGAALDSLDAAIVNTDWALRAGLDPATDRIAQEALEENPYRNLIAVKAGREAEHWVATLVAAYHNDTVKDALARAYKGTGIPAW